MKNCLLNLGKQALQSVVQVLDNISRDEDVKMTIGRRAVEGARTIGKRSLNRAAASKTRSHKQTVTWSRLKATKKKRVSAYPL